MIKIKSSMSILICVYSSAFVVLWMYSGNSIFLWTFFVFTCAGMLIDSIEHKIEYLIFFVPWIYTIKFDFSGFSLYVFMSALFVVTCLYHLTLNDIRIKRGLLVSFAVFVVYAAIIPLCSGDPLIKTLGFILNYASIFMAVAYIRDKKVFFRYSLMYAAGLVMSGIVRLLSYSVPEINTYIETMTRVNTVDTSGQLYIRFAGLDLDPNYFAVQILTIIACLMITVYYSKSYRKISVVLIMILSVFGLLSLSKMFLLVYVVLIITSLFCFFKENVSFAVKYLYLLLISGVGGIYFARDYLYQAFFERFTAGGFTESAVTTGRSDLWMQFAADIFYNFKILVFGAGCGSGFISTLIAHNMYLTALYYMGILGIMTVLVYFVYIKKSIIKNLSLGKGHRPGILNISYLPLYVVLIANTSLDSFIMDYFPVQMLLVLFAFSFSSDTVETKFSKQRSSPADSREFIVEGLQTAC